MKPPTRLSPSERGANALKPGLRALWPAASLLALLGGVVACGSTEPPADDQQETAVPQVEVPPADGPKLVVLLPEIVVRDRPSASGTALGYLRAGARMARSAISRLSGCTTSVRSMAVPPVDRLAVLRR